MNAAKNAQNARNANNGTFFAVFAVIAVFAGRAWGGAGTTTAAFLEFMPNARAVGLGESYVALADDASALAWNPSGLSRIRGWSAHAMYHAYIEGVSSQYMALGFALPGLGGVGLHLLSLDSGDIYKTTEDSSGNLAEAFTVFWVSALSISVGWGTELLAGFRVGGAVKWLQQEIDRNRKTGTALDAGAQWNVLPDVCLGVSIQNAGLAIDNKPLPFTVRVGGSINLLPSCLMATCDTILVQGSPLSLRGGLEWSVDPQLALRAGYQTGLGTGGLSGLHAGLGTLLENALRVDYAVAPMGDFGYSHRASLSVNF